MFAGLAGHLQAPEERKKRMRQDHGSRNPQREQYPEWIELTEKLVADAQLEWFNAWKW